MDEFLATLAPGEDAWAAELYGRWKAWALAHGGPSLTATAFGRLAARSPLVTRYRGARRGYVRAG